MMDEYSDVPGMMDEYNGTPDYLSYSGDGYCDITLDRQVTLRNGVKIDTIRMREPTVDDQVRHEESPGLEPTKNVKTIANLCEMSPEDIRRLPARSFIRLKNAYQGFFS